MQERDFETLAGSIPFPASDIAADYSPVEKELIKGSITRSLVVPVHKGPSSGKIPITDQYGREIISKNGYNVLPLVAPVTEVGSSNHGPILAPDFGYGIIGFMVTALANVGAGNVTFGFHAHDRNNNPYKLYDSFQILSTFVPPFGAEILLADETAQPYITNNWHLLLEVTNPDPGFTITWYADLYYR